MNFQPFFLTFKLAIITTLLLLVISLPLAYWLAFSQKRKKYLVEAVINTPLVLPPSVLGFYLLLLFNPENFLGKFLQKYFSLNLLFSFSGLIVGSVIFSLPFMVQNLQNGFQNLPPSLREAAYTLGKSELETLFKILLPNMKPAILAGMVLTFAHTLGEFGVVLLIGGNIPGQTKLISIAIYEEVERLNYRTAHLYSLLMLILSLSLLALIYFVKEKSRK